MSHIFSLKRCHWVLLNWKWKYKYMLAHFFFIVTMTNLFFSSYFVNWMKVECFGFLGILLPHFSYLWSLWSLLGMVIPPCFQICTDFYILGEKKSPLWLTIASVLSSYLLCFSFSFLFFWKILGKIAALSFFLITSFLSCCSFVMLYSDCCFKGHPYQ